MGICHSYTPDGRCVSLLKILLTNYCIYDCQYCVNRVTSDMPRARFTPEEVVWLTLEFYRRNYIEGLFLSSGIIQSADYTMEQLVAVARSLREEHYFGRIYSSEGGAGGVAGIVGAGGEVGGSAERRISNCRRSRIWIGWRRRSRMRDDRAIDGGIEMAGGAGAGGSGGESRSAGVCAGGAEHADDRGRDAEHVMRRFLRLLRHLYRSHQLRRVYYSAFSPIPHKRCSAAVNRAAVVAGASAVSGGLADAVLWVCGGAS